MDTSTKNTSLQHRRIRHSAVNQNTHTVAGKAAETPCRCLDFMRIRANTFLRTPLCRLRIVGANILFFLLFCAVGQGSASLRQPPQEPHVRVSPHTAQAFTNAPRDTRLRPWIMSGCRPKNTLGKALEAPKPTETIQNLP